MKRKHRYRAQDFRKHWQDAHFGFGVTEEPHWRELQAEAVSAREERKRLTPQTRGQEFYFKAIETSSLTICVGPAGTGKTYMACGIGAQMLKENRVQRLIVTNPGISCGKDMGALPGGIDEKMAPFVANLLEALGDFLSPKQIKLYREQEAIQVVPLQFMQGRTFKDSFVILDEAQNASYAQLTMFVTRLGRNSRLVVNGDTKQTCLTHCGTPLAEVMNKLDHLDIAKVYLTREDIVRHGLVQYLVETLT